MGLNASGYNALVVDDDPEVRRTVSRALRAIGFSCNTASDGEMARQKMVLQLPDLLVTDLRMPVRHGHRLMVEALGRKSPPLVVVITGLVEPTIAFDIIARGAKDVTLKPFNAEVCAAKWLAMLQARDGESTNGGGESDTRPTGESSAAEPFGNGTAGPEKGRENRTAGFAGSIRLLTHLLRRTEEGETGHAARVERLAEGICSRIDADPELVSNVRLASLLHDVGQFGMPGSIRTTPQAEMSAEQFEAYKRYPEFGAALLSEVKGCEDVVELVLAHAENFDGTGFPHGLSREAIPLGSRIIRLANGVETYGMGLEIEEREEKLSSHLNAARGSCYDPELLDASLELLVGSLQPNNSVQCTVSSLLTDDVLEEDLMSSSGHLIARKGAIVNMAMRAHIERILGDVSIRVQRAD